MSPESLIPLLVILPLSGFAITALIGRRLGKQAHWVPVLAIFAVWLIAMAVSFAALTGAEPFGEHGYGATLFDWIPAGAFHVEAGFFVDQLTACLLIVVTTVGLLVHVYSIGYMSHDPGYWRFFAYLNFFMFSMLVLVLADSWLLVFLAWELVGLSSYLLIGFWFRKRSAALAAKKAFIVNRVGDVGFALGIMAIFVNTGTLDIRESLHVLTSPTLVAFPIPLMVVALLVFAGAMGKSAQFPLHVWLPDAMEGPTPVSALIHAATMVNAGVYLVARANPLFAASPSSLVVVAAIGIFTAILAASIAMTQTDIKRVLAYSTLSQLGYMFAALGVGAFTAAIFHLMTHGFFKGLLFLGSGSVIHAVHEEQDMRRMGGLSKKIPITYVTMLIGSLAIAGIPPLAGFFSKDEILGESFKQGYLWVWAIGFVVAGITAFYMFRLMGLTFWGAFRGRPRRSGTTSTSRRGDDRPADPARHRLGVPGHVPRAAARRQPDLGVARPRSSRDRSRPSAARSALRPVRHRRRAHPRQRDRGGRRHRDRVAPVRRRASAACAGSARPERVRELSAKGPVPLPRVAEQMVVRRAQPPAVHRHRRKVATACGGSTARSSTAPSTARPLRRSPPAAGSAASRPAGSRTTRWASRSG